MFGAAGIWLMTTVVDEEAELHPPAMAVTVYVPASAVVVPNTLGFCCDDEKPFGPVQLYVAPFTVVENKFKVCPLHNGELLVATGAEGGFVITTAVLIVVVPHSLVTASVMVCEPTPLKEIFPGLALVLDDGVPPLNVQL